jgi:hypothetical protein
MHPPPALDLPACDIERNQSSGTVGDGMDFGRASASAAADGLRIGAPSPPALHRCASDVMLSMHCRSAASIATRLCSVVSQMPAFEERLKRL